MKITKRQLRRIIREEYDQLPQAGDPVEKARLKAQRDSARIPSSTAMGHTAASDDLFGARENFLALIEELLNDNEYHAYIDSLVRELKTMKKAR